MSGGHRPPVLSPGSRTEAAAGARSGLARERLGCALRPYLGAGPANQDQSGRPTGPGGGAVVLGARTGSALVRPREGGGQECALCQL